VRDESPKFKQQKKNIPISQKTHHPEQPDTFLAEAETSQN
jgi:hypothetical protein